MSDNLREFLNEFVVVYFDDIITYLPGESGRPLETCATGATATEREKGQFETKEMCERNRILNGESTRMQDKKLKSILDWPIPKSCKDIEEFRGMARYYRQYRSFH
jgi:hypothetical protein